MKHTLTPMKLLLPLIVMSLLAAACGSQDDTVATAPIEPTAPPVDSEPAGVPASDPTDADQPVSAPVDPVDPVDPVEGRLIGSANMGGEVGDPKPTAIDAIAILESYPEQIQVEFTAGDEGCLAANARAVATDTEVIITLEVGITTDALSRSCLAGQFPQSLLIALDEGLDGRQVVTAIAAEPDAGQDVIEPPDQPFELKIIGLSEANAEQAVADEGLEWRVVARDGEYFAVTDDLRSDRVNVNIVDGVVTDATIG